MNGQVRSRNATWHIGLELLLAVLQILGFGLFLIYALTSERVFFDRSGYAWHWKQERLWMYVPLITSLLPSVQMSLKMRLNGAHSLLRPLALIGLVVGASLLLFGLPVCYWISEQLIPHLPWWMNQFLVLSVWFIPGATFMALITGKGFFACLGIVMTWFCLLIAVLAMTLLFSKVLELLPGLNALNLLLFPGVLAGALLLFARWASKTT